MTAHSARVLVVEDDDAIRRLLVASLRREAFAVDEAVNGAEALRLTAEYEYAVILLDLMLPLVDGFQFLDAFHRVSISRRSVVMVMTAFDDRVVGRLSPGRVHAILRKPFDVPPLVEMIREVVNLWEQHTLPAPKIDLDDSATRRRARLEG